VQSEVPRWHLLNREASFGIILVGKQVL